MPKIHRLAPEEAQKIAAGEVAERPANVLKELIENALDAGATDISIFLEEGGKKLIRIIDNGCGMSKEDAYLCLEHHATSKITTVDQLTSISTFGFRGEALSSIASVSHMTLRTKEADENTGVSLSISAGKVTDESTISLNTGTDIAVRDLFFNVPARQKFLKSKDTELRSLVQLFQAMCLAYKNVAFKLAHHERTLYTIPAVATLEERISQIVEPALKKRILITQAHDSEKSLSLIVGFSPTDYTRFDRSQIVCFVNNRWVKNYKLGQALVKAYQGMLQPQRYPAAVLFISIDPKEVDINIHPRKEEVQFLHPRIVYDLIETTVQKKLEEVQKNLFKPSTRVETAGRDLKEFIQPAHTASFLMPPKMHSYTERPSQENQEAFIRTVAPYFSETLTPVKESNMPAIPESDYQLIGQVHLTYILIERQESLVYIDQHAAHERIIYEKLKEQFQSTSQVRLLFPQVISLNKTDLDLLEPFFEVLQSFGVQAQRMTQSELMITQTPLFIKNQSLADCIKQAVALLHEHASLKDSEIKKLLQERIHASLSCKAAVKAGDKLSEEAMHSLIKELYAAENSLTCPHGRPTLWELRTEELEKKFKRDYRTR